MIRHLLAWTVLCSFALAQNSVKPVPPPGIPVPEADRAEITAGLTELAARIAQMRQQFSHDAKKKWDAIPNVEIFYKSAEWALRHDEIFDAKQIAVAKAHVKLGLERAAAVSAGSMPWDSATGLVVRRYRSKIDDSVQPYGLLIPDSWKPDGAPVPLHFWCHGRNEKLSELAFIEGSMKNKGEFTPPDAIVCFLYGRYCNANKFAGEIDLFEALEDIRQHYAIDPRRIVVRGFSMGGAACATHHAGLWAAAAPGAGFAETAEFFKVFAPGKEAPPWWEQILWRWYDSTTMAANLANTTTVAYSGENDGQRQAAEIMLRFAEKEGLTFPHIIGPQTAHKYHPESKPKIDAIIDAAVAKGRDPFPQKLRHVTYSLIYSRTQWLALRGLERHWQRAEVSAEITGDTVTLSTQNVTALLLPSTLESPEALAGIERLRHAVINGQKIALKPNSNRPLKPTKPDESQVHITLVKVDRKWRAEHLPMDLQLRKTPEQCGPIDHAFMSRFIFIRPTGKPLNPAVGASVTAEMERAIVQWRRVFRGNVQVMTDREWLHTASGSAIFSNLILWGDPSSNAVIAHFAKDLPVQWTEEKLQLGTHALDASHHVPLLIYPRKNRGYIVLNSGPTFREQALLNNSDQTPKLPDWALIDIRTAPDPRWPGRVVEAGFFDEKWQFTPTRPQ